MPVVSLFLFCLFHYLLTEASSLQVGQTGTVTPFVLLGLLGLHHAKFTILQPLRFSDGRVRS